MYKGIIVSPFQRMQPTPNANLILTARPGLCLIQ